MKNNKRLGKGLEALIPQIADGEQIKRVDSLSEILVADIHANPNQPRLEFDRKGLDELKQSIEENGIIQPITVRRVASGYELVAGERRLRAITELGFIKIPAYVIAVDSDDKMLELALVENIQREDLNPIELAKGYQRLQKEYGLTQEAVAQKVGKDRATVANCIRLLKLPDSIQTSLKSDEISMGHARALMGLASPAEQIRLWKKTVKQGWNVRQIEEEVRRISEAGPARKKTKTTVQKKSVYIKDLEDHFRSILGTRVKISMSGEGKGKIEINYFSNEDLERVADLIAKIES